MIYPICTTSSGDYVYNLFASKHNVRNMTISIPLLPLLMELLEYISRIDDIMIDYVSLSFAHQFSGDSVTVFFIISFLIHKSLFNCSHISWSAAERSIEDDIRRSSGRDIISMGKAVLPTVLMVNTRRTKYHVFLCVIHGVIPLLIDFICICRLYLYSFIVLVLYNDNDGNCNDDNNQGTDDRAAHNYG